MCTPTLLLGWNGWEPFNLSVLLPPLWSGQTEWFTVISAWQLIDRPAPLLGLNGTNSWTRQKLCKSLGKAPSLNISLQTPNRPKFQMNFGSWTSSCLVLVIISFGNLFHSGAITRRYYPRGLNVQSKEWNPICYLLLHIQESGEYRHIPVHV